MGQRGSTAVFMPNKFVFPGGALDPCDLAFHPRPEVHDPRLAVEAGKGIAAALALCAIRELWEETGLRIGRPTPMPATAVAPPEWRGFVDAGLMPHTAALRFVFRAITPVGRPRRFDARFFLAWEDDVAGDVDDFSAASGELGLLQWLALDRARALSLPFITEVVLSEIATVAASPGIARPVPFFHHTLAGSSFRLL